VRRGNPRAGPGVGAGNPARHGPGWRRHRPAPGPCI
jgi:hypothetical protein